MLARAWSLYLVMKWMQARMIWLKEPWVSLW